MPVTLWPTEVMGIFVPGDSCCRRPELLALTLTRDFETGGVKPATRSHVVIGLLSADTQLEGVCYCRTTVYLPVVQHKVVVAFGAPLCVS